ncbi:MAG: YbjQ family protein [Chloroflexota bacterium]|nr:YbjQ family protein [Chloroflexota bacterium]MDQ6907320.1 YbjQ family protein [Chloroflexota bacterium]
MQQPPQGQAIDPRATSTAFEIIGFTIRYNMGVVRGVTVRSRSIGGQIGAAFQTMKGGNITLLTELAEQARQEAYQIMIAHAAQLGGNAIIGIRYDSSEVMENATEVIAYGTAVWGEWQQHSQ